MTQSTTPVSTEQMVQIAVDERGEIKTDIICFVKAASQMTMSEVSTQWYTRMEMILIKKEARRTSQGIQQRFKLDPENPKNYANCFSRVYDLCQTVNGPGHEGMQPLVHWIKVCPSRRGLELISMKYLQNKRILHHQKYMKSVLNIYERDKGLDPEILANNLRCVGEERSRAARMFSMCMGIADATASRETTTQERLRPRNILSKESVKSKPEDLPICLVSLTKSKLALPGSPVSLLDDSIDNSDRQESPESNTFVARNA